MLAIERSLWRFPNATGDHDGWLSPSQVNEYRDCPACYEAKRVLKVPMHASIHFAIGGMVHRATEHVAKAILAGEDWSVKDAVEVGAESFEEAVTDPSDEESGVELLIDLGAYKSLGAAKDHAVQLAEFAVPKIAQLDAQRGLEAVEIDLADLDLANPFPFEIRGRLDRVYVDALTDIKTSGDRKAPDLNNRIQGGIYGLYWWNAGTPKKVGFDQIVKGRPRKDGTSIPDFRTWWLGPDGDGRLTASNYQVVHELVMDIADRICRGDFPIGQGWYGKHSYDHGLPEVALAYSFPEAS